MVCASTKFLLLFIFILHREVIASCREYQPPSPDDKTVIFSEAFGRLGNSLLAYAFLYQLSVGLGVDAYVSKSTRDLLLRYFTPDSIKLASLEETFCNPGDIQWEFYAEHMRKLFKDKSYRTGRTLYLFPPDKDDVDGPFSAYRPESHDSPEHERFVIAYQTAMRRTLRFRPEISDRVRGIYEKVAKKFARRRHIKESEITFIGVHNRRTDHIEYTKQHHKQEPLEPEFFYDAMEEFREEYDHPVFLYVSDDMDWAREKLVDDRGDLFLVGGGDPDSDVDVGADLAVMASANATILTRGTFSMWGAVLCGGEYYTEYGMMVPDHILHPEDYADLDLSAI